MAWALLIHLDIGALLVRDLLGAWQQVSVTQSHQPVLPNLVGPAQLLLAKEGGLVEVRVRCETDLTLLLLMRLVPLDCCLPRLLLARESGELVATVDSCLELCEVGEGAFDRALTSMLQKLVARAGAAFRLRR